ncbi:MAG: cryptochrome/photolyase family protein [Fuerstiella sp.]|nr:cryptochrome/photolyase family protein [Fuerstiella sp.]
MRNLILILGDQLDHTSAAFDDFDADNDVTWMAEVDEEINHVWCHKLRVALFLSAMRHFRDELRKKDRSVEYHELQKQPSKDRGRSFAEILRKDVRRLKPNSDGIRG